MATKPTIDEAAQALVACVCGELEAAGRPACTCSTTVGTPLVANVCECEAGQAAGELWVNFSTMYPADPQTLRRGTYVYPCRNVATVAEFRVTLARCFPTLDERGQLPEALAQAERAEELHADLESLHRALTCCFAETTRFLIQNVEVQDPEGGLTAFVFTIAVEVRVPSPAQARPELVA